MDGLWGKDKEVKTGHLERQLTDILLAAERENEDNFSLSHTHKQRAKVTYDVKSLLPPPRKEPETVFERHMSDAEFLDYRRCRAETLLIKSKIIHKVHNDQKLTANETAYLKSWISSQNKESLLGKVTMVPSSPSSLRVDSISPEDFYTLN